MGRRVRGVMPQVRLHKRSGNGRVCIGGRDVYVGRYGSPEANARYLELMVEHGYLPAGSAPAAAVACPAAPIELPPPPVELPPGNEAVPAGLTLGELCVCAHHNQS